MRTYRHTKSKRDKIGKIISGWRIVDYHGYVNGTTYFVCQCEICGTQRNQNYSNLLKLKYPYCRQCKNRLRSPLDITLLRGINK